MKCIQCNEGVTVDGLTTVAYEKNGVAFLFRSVPAMICPVCNEEYVLEIQNRIEIPLFSFFSVQSSLHRHESPLN
ncbi:type II toxin-antitoxin system MqsA family antitoxin [Methanospirillum hungatei]|uniref:type II toxin-antitoxin system MqsA family antitoxin n=1 Tax=Methanospirillum hungatei TaxID=2203 RepID=UPI002A22BAEB|nr:type II toxin-antitoxin system MqsA family antitoxin [Methanospirillum hungatei]